MTHDSSRGRRSSGHALVVEDTDIVRGLCARMLHEDGFEVTEAASAAEALALLRRGVRFDVVLSDVLMPGMSGLDLARQLRQEHPHLPIALMSVWPGEDFRDYSSLGSTRFIQKPFTLEQLTGAVRAAMAPPTSASIGDLTQQG
jgi:two-component system cell cycle sensor histidine kinase/response regulator CckA